MRAKLDSLRRRQAAVIVWGGRSEHRQVMVTAGSYESMRAEALASLASAGLETSSVWADIAPAWSAGDRAARRPVIVSMASAADLSEAIGPLREAGIRLRPVTTPAVALASLARMRRAFAVPGAIEFASRSTTGLVHRAGAKRRATRGAGFPWGFIGQTHAHGATRSRDDISARLADAISSSSPRSAARRRRSVRCASAADARAAQHGGVADGTARRRSGAADSLFGIDAARLPEPADEFRERGAEVRLAWAAAADWPPAINLLRARRRQVSKAWLARAAVVAGAAAGLGGSWWVVERTRLWPASAPAPRIASNAPARGRGAEAVKTAPRAVVTPPAVVTRPPIVTPPPGVLTKPQVVTPPPVVVTRSPIVTPPPGVLTKPPVVTPPPVVATKPPVVTPPPGVLSEATGRDAAAGCRDEAADCDAAGCADEATGRDAAAGCRDEAADCDAAAGCRDEAAGRDAAAGCGDEAACCDAAADCGGATAGCDSKTASGGADDNRGKTAGGCGSAADGAGARAGQAGAAAGSGAAVRRGARNDSVFTRSQARDHRRQDHRRR
jgi:hypothetical protein